MVKKKDGSKRMTYKNKYKIVKKNKEKKRKERRDQRRNPHLRKKLKKDPGLPNLYPYKESFLSKLKEDAEDERKRQIENSIEGKKRKRENEFEDMAQDVLKKQRLHDDNEARSKDVVNTVNDNSRKSFFKEFRDVVKASDVILEVLDARDPIGTRSKQIESQIRSVDPKKRIVLVLNKIDLVPRDNVEQWLHYLRNELPAVGFKASVQKQKTNIGVSNMGKYSGDISGVSECLGAPGLISLLKNYCRSFGIKKSITVGIIGFPNVGKSSIINSLKRTKVVGVGAQPGFTKMSQTIVLDSNIRLLDCPGIIFDPGLISEADAALRNCVKFEQILDPFLPVEAILKRCTRENLMELYQIGTYKNAPEFLNNVAQRRGKLKQGGVSDINAAAKIVLLDWNIGKIPYYTIPPEDKHYISAEIVSNFSEEFNIDSIMDIEREMLETLNNDDYGFNSFTSNEMNVEMNLDSDSEDDQPEYVVNIKKKNEKIEPKKKRVGSEINPQLNKQMKDIIKKKKQSNENVDEEMTEQNFDFGTDFWANYEGAVVEADVDEFAF